MPRPRFKKLAADKRAAIIEAAGVEFAAHGFQGASLNAIIAAAGISKGAFYYYFDDKADLFATVIEYATEVTLRWNYVRDGMFDRLREHFSDEQITELTWRTALCGAFNRFNDVLQLDIEDGVEVLEQREDAA